MRVRLQLALDILTLERVQKLCEWLGEIVDIVEVGTPLIVRHGLAVVSEIRRWSGDNRPIFADTKIVDAGRWETMEAVEAGADMVSVLAGASPYTLEEVKSSADEADIKMVVDTIDLSFQDESKKELIRQLSPDYLCLHLATDEVRRGGNLLDHRRGLAMTGFPPERMMVAGGITLINLREVVEIVRPGIVVVGSGLSGQGDPLAVAQGMRRVIDECTI